MQSTSIAGLSYIGRVLFVDDNYDDLIVQSAQKTLLQKGLPVQYWDGKGNLPETIRNVRVVILDLNLPGSMIRGGLEYYYPAAKALEKIPGLFFVVIMAGDLNDKDPGNLRLAYENYCKSPFPGFILEKGLTKAEEEEQPDCLIDLIIKLVAEKKILNLMLLWESALDSAKDLGLRDLIRTEVENTILGLVKSVCEDHGEESAAQQLLSLIMRLTLRNLARVKEYRSIDLLVRELNKLSLPTPQDASLYHRLQFYHPGENEGVWTGDIYKVSEEQTHYQYAIVLTPRCDLAQGKTTSPLFCFAFSLKEEKFEDPEYPPYKTDSTAAQFCKNATKDDRTRYLVNRYVNGNGLPQRFYTVLHFADDEDEMPFGICFDFDYVRSVNTEDLANWRRICRLDSPFIEDMLQKFGSKVCRIGKPSWKC